MQSRAEPGPVPGGELSCAKDRSTYARYTRTHRESTTARAPPGTGPDRPRLRSQLDWGAQREHRRETFVARRTDLIGRQHEARAAAWTQLDGKQDRAHFAIHPITH